VDDEGGCRTCARSGTVVLTDLPDPDDREAFHGEIHATFPGGGSVDVVF